MESGPTECTKRKLSNTTGTVRLDKRKKQQLNLKLLKLSWINIISGVQTRGTRCVCLVGEGADTEEARMCEPSL